MAWSGEGRIEADSSIDAFVIDMRVVLLCPLLWTMVLAVSIHVVLF